MPTDKTSRKTCSCESLLHKNRIPKLIEVKILVVIIQISPNEDLKQMMCKAKLFVNFYKGNLLFYLKFIKFILNLARK